MSELQFFMLVFLLLIFPIMGFISLHRRLNQLDDHLRQIFERESKRWSDEHGILGPGSNRTRLINIDHPNE